MSERYVLFAIGPDKPGLVMKITEAIHQAGANLEDSRMSSLAGDFALIVLFSADASMIKTIKTQFKDLEKSLQVTTHFKLASQKQDKPTGKTYLFETTGHDQPGIVNRISAVLAKDNVNLVSLDTSLANAAFHGTPLFKVAGKITVPESVDVSTLQERLENTCEEMDLLLEFNPI